MRRTPRTRFAVASVAALATLAFGACGGDDDDDTEPVTTEASAETDAVEETAATVTPETATGSDDTTGDTTSGTSGGDVGTREEYVEAVTSAIEADMEDPSQAECFAEAIVSDDVYAAIQEQGLSAEDFGNGPSSLTIDEAQAEAIAGELAGCGELASQFGGSEAETACFTENLDNDQVALLVTLAAFGLEPTDELVAAQEDVEACLDTTTTTG